MRKGILALIALLMINIGVVYADDYWVVIDGNNDGTLDFSILLSTYNNYNDGTYKLIYNDTNKVLEITNEKTNGDISIVISTFPFTNQSNWVAGPHAVKPGETLQLVFKDGKWINPNEIVKTPTPLLSIILALITIPIIAIRKTNG
jgi:hypothetical protein